MDKTSSSKSLFSVQTIVLAEVVWAILALLFFLLFSATPPGQERPEWYQYGTAVFEVLAFLGAAILCFRNWRSPQIVSGRNVWLGIGLGMACYFLGSLLFTYWETWLHRAPDVSPGDFFYLLAYVFLIWGMVSAVASRRLNLEMWQWGVVAGVAVVGIAIAIVISNASDNKASASSLFLQPAVAQTAPATKPSPRPASPRPTPKVAPAAKQKPATPKPAVASPSPAATQKPSPVPIAPADVKAPVDAEKADAPQWAIDLENQLAPLANPINLIYLVFDVVLLVLAMMLLLAFWGGRFSQSWRMIAAAAFSFYIADMWFKYANRPGSDYQSGGLLEVFWVFSGVLFGIGAALEYDVSSRSRSRSSSRRRAS